MSTLRRTVCRPVWLCSLLGILPPVRAAGLFRSCYPFWAFFYLWRVILKNKRVCVVKVVYITPKAVVTVTAFRNQAVDMGVPFQIPAKGVENYDKARGEIHGLV